MNLNQAGKHAAAIALALAVAVEATYTEAAKAQAPSLREHRFDQDGVKRRYLLYTPRDATKLQGGRPVVIAMHGGGGTHRGMVRLTKRRWNQLADEHGFYVVYPHAMEKHWDFGEGLTSQKRKRRVDDLAYFRRVIDDVSGRAPIDASRIFATGHSRGGQASYFLACKLSDKIRAIAPMSMSVATFLEDDCVDGPPVGVAIVNGTHDPQVPYNGGQISVLGIKRDTILSTDQSLALWRTRNGCANTPARSVVIDKPGDKTSVTKTEWTDCRGAPVTLYRIENGGHTWPSGQQYLSVRLIGEVSKDIDGADEAWRFFSQFAQRAESADPSGSTSSVADRRFNVGYQVLDFEYPNGHEGPLTAAVWYPTAAVPSSFIYGGPTRGSVAADAAPYSEGGPYPLLVFSHGYAGSGLGSVFFAEALAARGWIVVCPDHHDRHTAVRIRTGRVARVDRLALLRHAKEISLSGPADRSKYLYRLDEIQLALDSIVSLKKFGQHIDIERIAVGGHSFGGYTALGVSGTIEERRDPRVKALLLFSTGAGGYLYTEDEFARVRVPTMLWMGEQEADELRGSTSMADLSARIYSNLSSPKYFLELKGGSHFSFNNRFSDGRGAKKMSGTDEEFDAINEYSIAFLQKHIAGDSASDQVLERQGPALSKYVREPQSEDLHIGESGPPTSGRFHERVALPGYPNRP